MKKKNITIISTIIYILCISSIMIVILWKNWMIEYIMISWAMLIWYAIKHYKNTQEDP